MSILSRIATDWARRCFGSAHVNDIRIRALRSAEEAIEMAQALGVTKDQVQIALNHVYSRPPGDAEQEIGGVLLTVNVICEVKGWDADDLFEREVRRTLDHPVNHFTKRNKEKLELGLR